MDFDGTLCTNKYPEIGRPRKALIRKLIRKQRQGHKLILWTCRGGIYLNEAVSWCKNHGLTFDAINSNLPEEIEKWGNDPRKIGADRFIDDRSISFIRFLLS